MTGPLESPATPTVAAIVPPVEPVPHPYVADGSCSYPAAVSLLSPSALEAEVVGGIERSHSTATGGFDSGSSSDAEIECGSSEEARAKAAAKVRRARRGGL